MQENILVICAHNDDQIIGCGGTVAKYADEGKSVHTIVLSHGELSHPWLKPEVVVDMRGKELEESNKILGGATIRVLGVPEGKFPENADNTIEELVDFIKSHRPTKIFTHSPDDPHPDHRATLDIVEKVADKARFKGQIYTFSVWNPVRTKKRDSTKLIIDTSSTFKRKIAAFKVHKSQLMTKIILMWSVYWKDIINGFFTKHRFAEVFFRQR